MPVTKGLIYQFELYLPPGSAGLLHVRLADGAYPLYPSEPEEWFFGDDTLITFPDRYFLNTPDQKLTIWHYNEDDSYEHRFQVRIGQVLAEIFIASFLPGYQKSDIAGVIQELQRAQDEAAQQRQQELIDYFESMAGGGAEGE
jgi:hypothetical protein